jgi:hypothetical protein
MNTSRANSNQSWKGESRKGESWAGAEAGLEHVLRNFRSSVHAWSEAELSRPRVIALAAHRHTWRFAATWALGCLLAAGSLSAGLYQHHRNQLLAGMTHQPQIQQVQQEQLQARQPIVSGQAGQSDENLMAVVDNDVSRPVPSAMEPLAQLMDEGGNQ